MVKKVRNAIDTLTRMLPEGFNSQIFNDAKGLLVKDLAYAPPEMENHYWGALARICDSYLPRPEEGKVWGDIKDMIWDGLMDSFDEPGDTQSD